MTIIIGMLKNLLSGMKAIKYDIYINEEETYKIVIPNQQPEAENFRKHCCNVMFPQIRQHLINKMKEGHPRTIEEKDAALALLNDDLQNREYENVALQAQRDVYQTQLQKCQDTIIHLKTRYVDHARDSGKDNIIIIV